LEIFPKYLKPPPSLYGLGQAETVQIPQLNSSSIIAAYVFVQLLNLPQLELHPNAVGWEAAGKQQHI